MCSSFSKVFVHAVVVLIITSCASLSKADGRIDASTVIEVPEGTFYGVLNTLYNRVIGGMTETTGALQFDTPAAPSHCRVTTFHGGRFGVHSTTVSWQDNSDNETGFTLEVWTKVQGQLVFLGSIDLGPDSTAYGFIGIFHYQYRVRAYNDDGDSAWSNWAH